MTPTPVGMRCPECSRQKTKVRTAATIRRDPQLTYVLIAMNVIAFVAMTAGGGGGLTSRGGGEVYANGALFGPAVADGDWWRIVTAGFLHAGILHLAFNMYFLYFLGNADGARDRQAALRDASTSCRCSAARSARCCSRPTR